MLTSHKLLYILPDVAYIAELLPTKKEHTFTIQTFRQINGEFIDDNDFIAENIKKLISKLDADDYHLILPDFLFTNTIVEVAEADESKVIDHLKSKLLPELTLSPETHELKTFVLTNHGGKSKVQLSALEKSLMNPISQSAEEKGINIKAVSPLSWTIKSIVSLEPSISIVQMGTHVYLAQHYIGIDQAMDAKVDDVANLSETIKTLKGAEPSIQTVYLITNQLVEEKLKENLSDTLPLQQLATFSEEESEMPSYVKFGIEAGMKTLSLDAFPVPKFPLPKPTEDAPATVAAESEEETKAVEQKPEEEKMETESETTAEESTSEPKAEVESETDSDLPKPAAAPAVTGGVPAAAATTVATAVNELSLDDQTAQTTDEETDTKKTTEPPEDEVNKVKEVETAEPVADTTVKEDTTEKVVAPTVSLHKEKEDDTETTTDEKTVKETDTEKAAEPAEDEVDEDKDEEKEEKSDVIKNQSGLQPMLKMLGISFLVFLITVGLGIGVGRAFIYFTQQSGGTTSPTQSAEPTASEEPSPSPSPSPSPEPEIDVTELSILVVNATTKAGYAGDTKDELDAAEFGTVTAGNAKGDYEENGTLVLMEEENKALIDVLEEATGESLTFEEGYEIEDAQGTYDAVVVLTE